MRRIGATHKERQGISVEALPILGQAAAAIERGNGALDLGKTAKPLAVSERLTFSTSICQRILPTAD
jgi:hypothetical protein